jgi:hypothetical protein
MKWLMLFMEIIPLYSDNRINPYIQNAKILVVEAGGVYSYRYASKG